MQMPLLGVEPNLVNYNTAVRSLARGGEGAKVRSMLSAMVEREVGPLTLTLTRTLTLTLTLTLGAICALDNGGARGGACLLDVPRRDQRLV